MSWRQFGANTAIFSLRNQVLLRPPPYAHEDRVVFVWNSHPRTDCRKRASRFPTTSTAAPRHPPSKTPGSSSSAASAWPRANRPSGADHAVVLLHPGTRAHDRLSVLPADFELPSRDIALLVPFAFASEETTDQSRGNEFSSMIARLAPGATREQLDAQMKAIVDRNLDRLPQRRAFVERRGFTGTSVPIRDQLVGDVRAPLPVLLLMRATGRHRQVAIRTAIGAGRAHLVKQMLTEGIV